MRSGSQRGWGGGLRTVKLFAAATPTSSRGNRRSREHNRNCPSPSRTRPARRGTRGRTPAAAEKETILRDSFAALSRDALERNNRTFLDLAQTKLGEFQQSARVELDGRHKAIADLVQPLKESLARVDGKLHDVEKERAGSNAKLDEQLRALAHTHQSLQVETNKLVRALRSPNQRGRWGEVQLRNVVERSGMVRVLRLREKESVSSDGRRLTPDMIVRLPNGACIVIDSKVPIDAYLNAADAPTTRRASRC